MDDLEIRRLKLPVILFLIAVNILICGIGSLWLLPAPKLVKPGYTTQDGVSPVMQSTTASPPKYSLHVLFIGNSFTYTHDIPHQLVDIASADPQNETQFFVQSVTRAHAGLKELWEDGKAAQAIQSGHWDYVVLQQHSSMASSDLEETRAYAKRFTPLIKDAGAKAMVYMTWVDKPGSHLYAEAKLATMREPATAAKNIAFRTYQLAQLLDAEVAPVGVYWMQVLAQQPGIELYEADEHNPSVAGSYMSALVFYKTLSERDIMKILMCPYGVAPDTAQKIRLIVSHPLPTS